MTPCTQCGIAQSPHFCAPRARRVVNFFERILVHTKGRWARMPFILEPWQRNDIIEPLFGMVIWNAQIEDYIRLYRVAWIELGRKNGKSELLAGIALYMLTADGEEQAEVYGAGKDRDQAGKVYKVAERMIQLQPALSSSLRVYLSAEIIKHPESGSWYECVPSDPKGNLGHNPHCVVADEIVAWPDGMLWEAFRTGMGMRTQPLLIAATTAGDDKDTFAGAEHDYCERVLAEPELDPRRFVYLRNTPLDSDPMDRRVWPIANPALGSFLMEDEMEQLASEAQYNPVKLQSFKQYRLNMWVSAATRWMKPEVWDACRGRVAPSPSIADSRLIGKRVFGGIDLSSKIDLTAMTWLCPDTTPMLAVWRFWVPEDQVPILDSLAGGIVTPWIEQGWLKVCPGASIDYDMIYEQIDEDRMRFKIADINYDPMMAAPIVHELEKRAIVAVQVSQGFAMSEPIKETMKYVLDRGLEHQGNPVARWNVLSTDVKQDDRERLYFVKPRRGNVGKRIDGTVALVLAIDGVMRRGKIVQPARKVVSW